MTKSVTFESERTGPVVDPWETPGWGFSLRVNREDFGASWNRTLEAGGVVVSENVTLEFDISATKST